jgi:hypothetical protein
MLQEHADKRRVRIVGAASTLNHPENESRQRDRDGIGARSGLADFVELLGEVRSEERVLDVLLKESVGRPKMGIRVPIDARPSGGTRAAALGTGEALPSASL